MPNLYPSPRSVYILGDGLLFDDLIAQMLVPADNLRVIKRIYSGEATFVTDVNKWSPNVIFLNESARFNCEKLIALLSRIPLTRDLRIIIISLNHENIRILDQPAGTTAAGSVVLHIIPGIKDRNELLDLVTGKQLSKVIVH
jgi:hypothetical protein